MPHHHKHEVVTTTTDRPSFGPVYRTPFTEENKAAHGGLCYSEVCACGATRKVNQNGRHFEYAPWKAGA